jgi:glycolate oxidase
LLIGSHGTLAVITAANLKVYPAPQQTRTFVADFASLSEAIAFRDTVVRSPLTPMCLEIASPLAQEFFSSHSDRQTWRVMLRAGGSDAVTARYARDLGSAVTHVFEAQAEEQYWNSVIDFGERVSARHQNAMVVALSVAPSELQHAIEVAERVANENNLLVACSGRCAIAALNLAFIPMPQGAPVVTQYAQALTRLRESLAPDAACVVTRCADQVKQHVDVWGATATDVDAMRAVKRALDGNDVLNRGRFVL